MRILSFLDETYLAYHLDCGPDAAEQLRVAIRLLERSADRPLDISDLDEPLLFAFARWLRENGRSPGTIKSRVNSIMAIWREADRCGKSQPLPKRIPRCRIPRQMPQAWQIDEVGQLIDACNSLRGQMTGLEIARRDWWRSLLLFLYDSGTRIGAALAINPSHVNLSERYVILSCDSSKTEVEQIVVISQETADAVRQIYDHRRQRVWPAHVRREALYSQLHRLLRVAGLPDKRNCMFHRLRKTNATWSAKLGSIEMAQRQLGHRSSQMTLDHYIDPRIARTVQSAEILPRPRAG